MVDQHLSKTSMLELYDSVMIPALTMLERDRRTGTVDPEREEFVFLSIREMVSEFAELGRERVQTDDAQTERRRRGRILCVPASHESDEITATMLAQLLEAAGYAAHSFSNNVRVEQLRHLVAPTVDDVVCISALPLFAFAPARTLDHSHVVLVRLERSGLGGVVDKLRSDG